MQRTEAGRGLGGLTKGKVFSLALSLMVSQEDLACKSQEIIEKKKKSKEVLLYPRAPLKIKCFCNEFDLTVVESNQGRDAVQSLGEGVRPSSDRRHGNSRGRHKQAQTRFLVRWSGAVQRRT